MTILHSNTQERVIFWPKAKDKTWVTPVLHQSTDLKKAGMGQGWQPDSRKKVSGLFSSDIVSHWFPWSAGGSIANAPAKFLFYLFAEPFAEPVIPCELVQVHHHARRTGKGTKTGHT